MNSFNHDVFSITKGATGFCERNYIRTDSYCISTNQNNDIITISRNGITKSFRVKWCSDYTYCVQKTQIKAAGGAAGLLKFLTSESWRAVAVKAIDNIFITTKEVV